MDMQMLLKLAQDAIVTTFYVSLPLLGVALVVGTVISLLQTVTQIQEQTLTFVPKFIAILLTLLFMAGFLMDALILYTSDLLKSIPGMVG